MMKLYTLGAEVLRKPAARIVRIDEPVRRLARNMTETMYEDDGIGLAGPQVGVEKQIFVCHAQGDIPRVFINPQIIGTSQEQVSYEEGCLSVPGVYGEVLRPAEITVQAFNENGKPFRLDADGMLARVIQHEIDHLRGVLFIDHLQEKHRQKLLKVYAKQ
jgi:peptide deformylase